ncbi:MAG: lactate utilization protein C [Enterobacteriaceae bacterium]|jgi:L-lactate dehydrogenase complex protein LldG|nr:lactate utilization protein C [Enterobacteriaceae bacterium]
MLINQQNRDTFLSEIAAQLGRAVRHQPVVADKPVNDYAQTRLSDKTQDELCKEFTEFAETQKVKCVVSRPENLIADVITLCKEYGSTPVVISGDQRLKDLGITAALKQQFDAYEWEPNNGDENIHQAEKAKIGLVFAEAGLTESGGVVLFSAPERGRSVSLLPETSIFVLRKSDILPRVAQMAQRLHKMAEAGERMPSCINLIGGPSSTADIELIKVFGVHGPVHAAYVVLEDC